MKKIFFIFIVVICHTKILFGQITVDSIFVYQTSGTDSTLNIVDSIYISGTHTGQVLTNIQRTPYNDGCGFLPITLTFKECDSTSTTFYDTMIVFGYYTSKIWVVSKWDTTVNCPYPREAYYTDTIFWDSCAAVLSATDNLINEKQVKIYPNPAQNLLKIEYLQTIRPRKIQLININGSVIKSFEPNERLLDIQDVISGIYILMIETEDGRYLRKKVMIQ